MDYKRIKKGKRGGRRVGAGAPRKEVKKDSIVMRVPTQISQRVRELINEYNVSGCIDSSVKEVVPVVPIEVKDLDTLAYDCGCVLDSGLFRRNASCKIERSKH